VEKLLTKHLLSSIITIVFDLFQHYKLLPAPTSIPLQSLGPVLGIDDVFDTSIVACKPDFLPNQCLERWEVFLIGVV
jgi:hypothetical protein